MPLRRFALVFALCAGVGVAACGFAEAGALDVPAESGVTGPGPNPGKAVDADGSAMPDGSSADTGSMPMGVPVCNPPTCTLPAPPAGWELVLLGTSSVDACPSGFDPDDAIESPVAGANACACAACVKTGTTCSTGSIPSKTDNGGGACGSTSSTLDGNSGNCQNAGGSFGQDDLIVAPAAARGTCTAASTPVPANVVSQPRRVCTRQPGGCSSNACSAPTSMKACIGTTGDVACPSGTKHVVGSGVTLACPACGCSISSAICGGTMDFYPQQNCGGTPITLTSGVCKQDNGANFQSFKWKGIVASEVCATTPAAPTTTTLTAARTVCCP